MALPVFQMISVFHLMTLHTSLISANNSFYCDYRANCTLCPEDVLAFVCSVSDGAATIWRGSFFNCPNRGNEIVLRHSTFENGVIKTCNDGAVVAYSTEVTSNSHTSQLNVTVGPEMYNETIECVQDGLSMPILVGACTLIPTTEPTDLNPPDKVHVSDINPNLFAIKWSPPESNCPVAIYNIANTNCGVCPNTTSNTSVTCTNLMIDGQVCSVAIQAMACGNNSESSEAAKLAMILRVISAPEVTATWTNQLSSILTSFIETEQFFISDGIDGSATNYTITYADSFSGRICDSVTISASTCISGRCNHMFEIPFACSDIGILITVFATNILGDGPSSEPVLLLKFNQSTPESDAQLITLYSIVGGTSFAIMFSFVIIIIILANLLKKVYVSFQSTDSRRSSNNPEPINEPNAMSNEIGPIGVHAYNLFQQPSLDEDDKAAESRIVTEECRIYENHYHEIDKTLNLDNLLLQIRDQVTPKWYQFGLSVGINKETLDEFSNFPPEECIVETSDLWLRTNETTVTWRDVADALKRIGCHRLAERILKVYKTGNLPEGTAEPMEESSITSNDEDSTNELSKSQPDQPPLPPRTYQSTN